MTARAVHALRDVLASEPHVRAVAAGKAAVGMAQALDDALGRSLTAGVLTAAAGVAEHARWRLFPASHPKPSADSERAGRAALALADQAAAEGGLLVVCLSGGASAMLAVPAPGLTLADKARATDVMLAAGIDIAAMNVVRRHLSAIKGGQLAARAGRSITFSISDVSGPNEDDPAVIGSGPTAGDNSTFREALDVLERHAIVDRVPSAVITHLRAGVEGRVPGPRRTDDGTLRRAAYWIVASRQDAMRAAAETARRLGYNTHVEEQAITGEARVAAGRMLDALGTHRRPACFIASGETTVVVRGGGRGGRNQEFATAACEPLAALRPAALASIGTDGIDGPTDAAGAFVDAECWTDLGSDARTMISDALDANDTYPLLDGLGALVRTGPTGTNVGDLQVVLLQ